MSFESLFDSTCSIKRHLLTKDTQGGYTSAYKLLYRRVPCRFETSSKKGGQEIQAYDKSTVFPDGYIYLQWRSGINEGDHVFLNGRKFEIKLIENWSEQNRCMTFSVVELERGE